MDVNILITNAHCVVNINRCVFTCIGGKYVWPGLAEVNTRARRFVSAWIRYQKREETKLAYLQKVSSRSNTNRSYLHVLYIINEGM